MKFNDFYNQIINEIKTVSGPNTQYRINDDVFKPIIYKDVCICGSALNSDKYHLLKQLKIRTNNKYNLNDLLIITKRAIDKILLTVSKNKTTRTSYTVYSKQYPLIKVELMFELNRAKNIFSDDIDNCKYFCFIYTVLSQNMTEDNRDKQLLVESNNILIID